MKQGGSVYEYYSILDIDTLYIIFMFVPEENSVVDHTLPPPHEFIVFYVDPNMNSGHLEAVGS